MVSRKGLEPKLVGLPLSATFPATLPSTGQVRKVLRLARFTKSTPGMNDTRNTQVLYVKHVGASPETLSRPTKPRGNGQKSPQSLFNLLQRLTCPISNQIAFVIHCNLFQRGHNGLSQLHQMLNCQNPDQFIRITKQTASNSKHTG